jgi:hypothetical protein
MQFTITMYPSCSSSVRSLICYSLVFSMGLNTQNKIPGFPRAGWRNSTPNFGHHSG